MGYARHLECRSFGIVSSTLTGATLDSRRTLSSPDSGRNGDRDPGPAHTGDSGSASSGGLAQWKSARFTPDRSAVQSCHPLRTLHASQRCALEGWCTCRRCWSVASRKLISSAASRTGPLASIAQRTEQQVSTLRVGRSSRPGGSHLQDHRGFK
jgi:hypothetical protein